MKCQNISNHLNVNFEYIKDIDDFVDDRDLFNFDQIGRLGVVYMIPFKNELMQITGVARDSNSKHNDLSNI